MGPKTVNAGIRKQKKKSLKNRKCAIKLKHHEIWKNKQYLLGKESARDQKKAEYSERTTWKSESFFL